MKYKSKLENFYHLPRLNEIGRSMVEMLGVLAVVGVLSIGGIMGYTYAMDKYRANDIVNEVNIRNRDTWNLYQTKDLPEEQLTNWRGKTATGFTIGIYPRSSIVFDVEVSEVPFRVCRQVMQSQIEGPLFIWTRGEGYTKQIFNGNNSVEICGTDKINIVFTTSLEAYGEVEGLRDDVTDERDQPIKWCIDDNDCELGCETCGTGYVCRSTCSDSTPICTEGGCVKCELNIDCPNKEICNEYTHECEQAQEQCATGAFRTKNGACVSCDSPANMKIDGSNTPYPGDELTGIEMCRTCAGLGTERQVEGSGDNTYCSYRCTKGISYQAFDGQCIDCTTNGHKRIASGSTSLSLCTTCSGHFWYNLYSSVYYCRGPFTCTPKEQFIASENEGTAALLNQCISCTETSRKKVYNGGAFSNNSLKQELIDSCNNCAETVNGIWGKRYYSAGYCYPECQQPADTDKKIEKICRSDANDTQCTRQWQNTSGTCLPCNYTGSNTKVVSDTDEALTTKLKGLCEACGRRVNDTGYCVPKGSATCQVGTFLAANGKCTACGTTPRVEIESDELSGCTANCKKNGNGAYDKDGTINSTFAIEDSEKFYCYKKCADKTQFVQSSGYCYDCNVSSGASIGGISKLEEICEACESTKRTVIGNQCSLETCQLSTTEKQFHDTAGNCHLCSQTDYSLVHSDTIQECTGCGNRVIVSWYGENACVLFNPGENGSGACNSLSNTQTETYNQYDGKLFMDRWGYCRRCDDKAIYYSFESQCTTCSNRRYEGHYCVYGLCDEEDSFIDTNNKCISCNTATDKVSIPTTEVSMNLCRSCDNKRVITVGEKDEADYAAYCVSDCAGLQWQALSDGKCRSCTELDDSYEIGSDDKSIAQCRECDRIAYSKISNNKTYWYCSAILQPGTSFIDSTGKNVSCSSGDTALPDSQDARNLCVACDRKVENNICLAKQ